MSEGEQLSHEETINSDCYGVCSNAVTSSQTFASCRFQGVSPHDNSNFDQNQESVMLNRSTNRDITNENTLLFCGLTVTHLKRRTYLAGMHVTSFSNIPYCINSE